MRKHHLKYIVSAPIIFTLLLNQSGIGTTTINTLALSVPESPFIETGEVMRFSIDTQSLIPVNAVGITLSFPPGLITIEDIDQHESLVDLWVEEPKFFNDQGYIKLSGGVVDQGGFVGRGHIATIIFRANTSGKIPITIKDAVLLARDGKGTNVLESKKHLELFVRDAGKPSPDINGDGELSLSDAAILYIAMFRGYNPLFDLSGDGMVNFKDIGVIADLL